MNIYEKLSAIQAEVNVPKNLENKFGGFRYRSAEMILETVKPVCKKHGAVLILTDSVKECGNRFYVEACAWLQDTESNEHISVFAYAREEETKKGMDASQITGSASSYARKYALNGLFNLDDNRDPDSNEYTEVQNKAKKEEAEAKIKAQSEADSVISEEDAKSLAKMIQTMKAETPVADRMKAICKMYGVKSLSELKHSQYVDCVNRVTKGAS